MKGQVWTIGLVAILASLVGVVLGTVLMGPSPAHARAADSSDDIVVCTGNIKGGNQDVLYIMDTRAERMVIYEVEGRTLSLAVVRNTKYDFQLKEFPPGKQRPTVRKVEKETEKATEPPMGGARKLLAVPGNFQSDQHDLLYVFDTQSRRLVIYEYNNKALKILAARDTRFDFKFDEYAPGRHTPSVKQVHEYIKKSSDD
jgi:hypothetical protein